MNDRYVPENAQNLMALGLFSWIQNAGKTISEMDMTTVGTAHRLALSGVLGSCLQHLVEAELVLNDGSQVALWLSLRDLAGKLEGYVALLSNEHSQLLKKVESTKGVKSVEVRQTESSIALLTGVPFLVLCTLDTGDRMPLLWDAENKRFRISVVIQDQGPIPALKHPVAYSLAVELIKMFPNSISLEDPTAEAMEDDLLN